MRGLDEQHTIRIRVPRPGHDPATYSFGSGYLTGASRALTAEHVLRADAGRRAAADDECQVLLHPFTDHDWRDARVIWVDPRSDLAVISVEGIVGASVPLVSLNQSTGSAPRAWHTRGFPDAGLHERIRRPEVVWGRYAPAGSDGTTLALSVESREPAQRTGWRGLSGAPVFDGDDLVGVIVSVPARWQRSLEAVRVAGAADRAGLSRALRRYGSPEALFTPKDRRTLPPGQPPPRGVVARRALLRAVVEALGTSPAPLVALTGAAGFGKTVLAGEVVATSAVLQNFGGPAVWLRLGEQVTGAALAAEIAAAARTHFPGADFPTTSDPDDAGARLGQLIDGSHRVIVIDDVWDEGQLSPLLQGARNCPRLITTRIGAVLPAEAIEIPVETMTGEESAELLLAGLPGDVDGVRRLLSYADGWALLLALMNGHLRMLVRQGTRLPDAAARVVDQLEKEGPAGVTRSPTQVRSHAVTASIEAGLMFFAELDGPLADLPRRYRELAIFPGGTDLPESTLAGWWGETGRLDEQRTAALCLVLADASFLTYDTDGRTVRMHEVVREYLRRTAAPDVPYLQSVFLDHYRRRLPGTADGTAWWELDPAEPYLWTALPHHLRELQDGYELDAVLLDLRWIVAKTGVRGPAAVAADLRTIGGPVAAALVTLLSRNAHLFAPLRPPHALGATFVSRMTGQEQLRPTAEAYLATFGEPRLVPVMAVAGDGPESLDQVLRGHDGPVTELAVDRAGTLLVSAGSDARVVFWDLAAGTWKTWDIATPDPNPMSRATDADDQVDRELDRIADLMAKVLDNVNVNWLGQRLPEARPGKVHRMALDPHGRWVAILDSGLGVAVREVASGAVWRIAAGEPVRDLAALGGDRLVTVDLDGRLRLRDIHDAWSSRPKRVASNSPFVRSDGNRLLVSGDISVGRDVLTVWEAAERRMRHVEWLTVHSVYEAVIAPDGRWVAGLHSDGIRIWTAGIDESAGAAIESEVTAIAAGAGDVLVLGHENGRISLLDVTEPTAPMRLLGRQPEGVEAVAADPNGAWVASGGYDGTIRIWQTGVLAADQADPRSAAVGTVAVGGDAIASSDGTPVVRRWDRATGAELPGWRAPGSVRTVAVVPGFSGRRLLAGCGDGTVHLLDVAADRPRASAATPGVRGFGPSSIERLIVDPGGSWIAAVAAGPGATVWFLTPDLRIDGSIAPAGFDEPALIAGTPDGKALVTGSESGRAWLWHPDGELLCQLRAHDRQLTATAVGPAGRLLALADRDGAVSVWSVLLGTLLGKFAGTGSPVRAIDLDDSAGIMVVGTDDGQVIVRRGPDPRVPVVLSGHVGAVRSVALSPDRRWVASAGDDGTVRVWSLATGTAVTALRLNGRLAECRWLDDGGRLYVTGPAGLEILDQVLPAGMAPSAALDPVPISWPGFTTGRGPAGRRAEPGRPWQFSPPADGCLADALEQLAVAVIGHQAVPPAREPPLRWIAGRASDGRRFPRGGGLGDLAAAVRERFGGRLLVLGGAGHGKTQVAEHLARQLAVGRRRGEPVPLLLAARDRPGQPMDEWVADRAVRLCRGRLRHGDARRLAAAGLIIPVIDGLDESYQLRQTAGMLVRHPDTRPFIATCRTEDFDASYSEEDSAAPTMTVAEILPLRADEVAGCLSAEWADRVRADPEGPLARALSRPVMLVTAQQPGVGLPDEGSRRVIEDRLWTYRLATFLPGLGQLAGKIESREAYSRSFSWPQYTGSDRARSAAAALFCLIVGALATSPVSAVCLALAAFVVFTMAAGWPYTDHGLHEAVSPEAGLRRARRTTLGTAFLTGTFGAVMTGLLYQTRGGLQPALVMLFAVGVTLGSMLWAFDSGRVTTVFGMAAGLAGMVATVRWNPFAGGLLIGGAGALAHAIALTHRSRTTMLLGTSFVALSGAVLGAGAVLVGDLPPATWSAALAAVLGAGMVTAVASRLVPVAESALGVLCALAISMLVTMPAALPSAGHIGFARGAWAGAALFGATYLATSDWCGFVVTRCRYAARGELPLRLMAYLAAAHRAGLLRQSGGVYEFRHPRLYELARQARPGAVEGWPSTTHGTPEDPAT